MSNTSSKHTPGPWAITAQDACRIISTGADGKPYARTLAETCGYKTEREANARLIAAAPELLLIAIAYRNLLKTMAHTEEEVATFNHINAVVAAAGCES